MATSKTYSPKVLASEIGCDPKSLRGYLRKTFPRVMEAKNTSWIIGEVEANAAREFFAKQRANSANVEATE